MFLLSGGFKLPAACGKRGAGGRRMIDSVVTVARALKGAALMGLVSFATTSFAQDAAPPALSPAAIAAQEAVPPIIPSAAFAEVPWYSDFKISPDGHHLLARSNQDKQTKLVVFDLLGKAEPFAMTIPEKFELANYRWAGSKRLLISLATTVPWYGDEARATRLLSYDIETREPKFVGRKQQGLEGDDVLYVDPDGAWILLSIQKTIYEYPSVFRFDLATGESKEVTKARSYIWEWIADNAGVVRMGLGFSGRTYRVVYRRAEGEDFQTIAKPKVDDEDAILDVIRVYQGSDEGYTLSNENSGRYALYRFNLATREIGEKVYDHPVNDITDYDTTADGKQLLYASYTDDRERIHFFDKELSELQGLIDGGLKGRQNWMTSWSRNKGVIMVWSGDSNDPGRYYIFEPAQGKMTRYFVPFAGLKPADLPKTRYVTYKARDGLEIPAYLTLPKGRPAKGLPLVILPHGGPYGVRDDLNFNTEVQFLVNRGYAVLQPNFRGSSGYGKEFSDKGYGQWGRTMQDDLDDGMDWLAKEGIIDPKRVCLVGSSYGGYAALWGAIRNPERYRCAVSFAGVTDLKRQLSYQLDFFISKKYQSDWRERVRGAADFDMASVSPVQQAVKLQVPVLIAYGEQDTTVPPRQSKMLIDALKLAGKKFETHSYADEGHGLDKPENLKDWLDRLEKFLAAHNPA
jgi:dipeptidyl aminopeptidase/acylaminoacyl peptidase